MLAMSAIRGFGARGRVPPRGGDWALVPEGLPLSRRCLNAVGEDDLRTALTPRPYHEMVRHNADVRLRRRCRYGQGGGRC